MSGVPATRNPRRSLLVEYRSRDYHLRRLGFPTGEDGYDAYLASDSWMRGTRAKWDESGKSRGCFVCWTTTGVELHHRTYKQLGFEELEDLIPLCRRHHLKVHSVAQAGYALYDAHRHQRAAHVNLRLAGRMDEMIDRVEGAIERGLFDGLRGRVVACVAAVLSAEDGDLPVVFFTDEAREVPVLVRFTDPVRKDSLELRRDVNARPLGRDQRQRLGLPRTPRPWLRTE